jgi:DinB superfamily
MNLGEVYEHACHLSASDGPFLAHFDLMLSAPAPLIRSIINSPEDESGALLNVDLDERLDQYVRERAGLVNRLKELSVEDWQPTAEHEAFRHYSVWIMFRHLLTHEMSHAYRIEELLLKKDWE